MRITRCLFGIDLDAIRMELLDREDHHQAELTELWNRLNHVRSSNAQFRQALALLNPEIAAAETAKTCSYELQDQQTTSMAPRGGRQGRVAQLQRAFWGVPTSEMKRIFADHEHDLTIEIDRVQSVMNMALVEHQSLRQDLKLVRQQLATQAQPPQPGQYPQLAREAEQLQTAR